MDIDSALEETREMLGAGKVFGEPVERNGVTVIPVAKISGGGGGGDDGATAGGGAGFGLHARPAGALIIDADGSVSWEVPFDRNKVIMGFQAMMIALIVSAGFVIRTVVKARARALIAGAAIGRTAQIVEHRLDA